MAIHLCCTVFISDSTSNMNDFRSCLLLHIAQVDLFQMRITPIRSHICLKINHIIIRARRTKVDESVKPGPEFWMNYLVEVKCSFHIHYWIFCFQGLNRNLQTLSRLEEMRDSYLEPSKSGLSVLESSSWTKGRWFLTWRECDW